MSNQSTSFLAMIIAMFAVAICPAEELKKVATFEVPGGVDETSAPAVNYSPDGKLLVCTGLDHILYLFDARTNKPVGKIELPGNTGENAFSISRFSPDGKLLACLSADKKVRFFETDTMKPVRTSEALDFDGGPLTFSHDGSKLIAVGAYQRTFFVIDVATAKILQTKKYESEDWLTVILSPVADEAAVAVVNPQLTVLIVSLTTGETLRENKVGGIAARGLKYSPDGKALTAEAEEILYLLNAADLKITREIEEFSSFIFSDGETIHYLSDGTVQPINFRTWKKSEGIKFETSVKGFYDGHALSPDGNVSALAFWNYRDETSNLVLVDMKGKQQIADLNKLGAGHVFDFDYSADGSRIATSSRNKAEIIVWDISPWSKPVAASSTEDSAFRTWTSADGNFQVEAELVESNDNHVKLKRKDTGAVVTILLAGLSEADQAFVKSSSP